MKRLYYNGSIIDTEDGRKYDWLLIQDKMIKAKGSMENMPKDIGEDEKYDLKGKTLIPALIDPHSHLTSYAISTLQPSLENTKSFDDIIAVVSKFIKETNPNENEFVVCAGYDQNSLKEEIHPTKELLNKEFPNYPVVLQHISGHMGVMNQKALDMLDISNDNNGLLQENDFISNIKRIPLPNADTIRKAIIKAQNTYASFGIATAQEGMIAKEMIPIFKMAENEKLFFIDILGYADLKDYEQIFSSFSECLSEYHNNVKIQGLKIFLDGSPQGKTAWMREAYEGEKDGYNGFGTMSDEAVTNAFKTALKLNKQLIAHCNGDAAADQILRCASLAGTPEQIAALRPVVIHSQLLHPEIMPKLKEYGFLLSFFPAHIYYWGETHIKNLGIKRAERLSSIKSALNEGLIYTIHQDTPVLAPNLFKAMQSAILRKTKEGKVLGEKEKITPLEALQAVTINAAYQYGEENIKGSLKEGKLADLAILEEDPLEIDPEKLENIKVVETIKEGNCIFSA